MIVRFPEVFDVDMKMSIFLTGSRYRLSMETQRKSLYILMSQNPRIEEKMRIRTVERVNTAISKVNMRDRIQIRQTLSIEATFALNQAKKVFQSKGVRCSLRRESELDESG